MSKNNYLATREEVNNLPLPTDSSIDSHQTVKQTIDNFLKLSGLIVEKEEFRISNEGEFVQGTYVFSNYYKFTYKLMFTWVSTYNKTAGFKSSFGITDGEVSLLITSKNNPQFKRVSIESSNQHALRLITAQVGICDKLMDEIIQLKAANNQFISLSRSQTSELTGELFFNDLISVTQLTKLREAMSSKYGIRTNKDFNIPLHEYHQAILIATQGDNKPSKWIKNSTSISDFIFNHVIKDNSKQEDTLAVEQAEEETIEKNSIEHSIVEEASEESKTQHDFTNISLSSESGAIPDFEL